MSDINIDARDLDGQGKPVTRAGVYIGAGIDLATAEKCLTDTELRDKVARRMADDVEVQLLKYFETDTAEREIAEIKERIA